MLFFLVLGGGGGVVDRKPLFDKILIANRFVCFTHPVRTCEVNIVFL